jgi:hypothetical protein
LIDDPVEVEDILKIPLWNSYFVKNENILKLKGKMIEQGCIFLNDLLTEDGNLLTFEQFQAKYNVNRLNILDFHSLIKSIPRHWRDVINVSNCRLDCAK